MAKVALVLEDDGVGGVLMRADIDPPINAEDQATPAQIFAAMLMKFVGSLENMETIEDVQMSELFKKD